VPLPYESANYIRQIEKPCYIYHLGDYDPSGVSAALNIEKDYGSTLPTRKFILTGLP